MTGLLGIVKFFLPISKAPRIAMTNFGIEAIATTTGWWFNHGKTHGYWEIILSGWWCNNHLEKYEFVSWDDDIPNMMAKTKVMFQFPPTRIWYQQQETRRNMPCCATWKISTKSFAASPARGFTFNTFLVLGCLHWWDAPGLPRQCRWSTVK